MKGLLGRATSLFSIPCLAVWRARTGGYRGIPRGIQTPARRDNFPSAQGMKCRLAFRATPISLTKMAARSRGSSPESRPREPAMRHRSHYRETWGPGNASIDAENGQTWPLLANAVPHRTRRLQRACCPPVAVASAPAHRGDLPSRMASPGREAITNHAGQAGLLAVVRLRS